MGNIRYVKREAIDSKLWDEAVTASAKGLPYGYSWYLDIVSAGKWQGLVEGAYERVMPLVWNAKLLGIRQLYQPVLSQQLGVFGAPVPEAKYQEFLAAIPSSYRYIHIHLNAELEPLLARDGALKTRTNLILDLDRPYGQIQEGYSRSLRKRINKARPLHQFRRTDDLAGLIRFYHDYLEKQVQLGNHNYALIGQLLAELLRRGLGAIYEVCDLEGQRRCIGFFIITDRRVINVFGASDPPGKVGHAMHLLLDKVIQLYAGKPLIFDFEGSEIKGVGDFFRSFGGVEENYSRFIRDRLPLPLRWLRSLKH